MKTRRMMLFALLFLIPAALGFVQTTQVPVPGIEQNTVWMYAPGGTHIGGTVLLKFYSAPPISASFSSRNPLIATVDPVTGRVRGVSPGITYVKARVFDGHCLISDSVKVTVGVRPLP